MAGDDCFGPTADLYDFEQRRSRGTTFAASEASANGDAAVQTAGTSEFYFNVADHTLYYDRNGVKSGGVTAIAVLDDVTALTKADFIVAAGYMATA